MNNQKQKIIIINQNQFGYNSATFYYCKYLRYYYDVKYLCWMYNKEKVSLNNVHIKYISRSGNILIRNTRFILHTIYDIKKNCYDIHIVKYFQGCSLLRVIFPQKKFILDIRTGSVNTKMLYSSIYDKILKIESILYKNITIISESLRQKLKIRRSKAFILPVGAEVISKTNKSFDKFNLLYVGTFNNRNLADTVIGFRKFYQKYKNYIELSYTIIGSGKNVELIKINNTINKCRLDGVVYNLGYIKHENLKKYFNQSNIGVSYIPINDNFDCQPPTKTFEYLLSGMCIIGTGTTENQKIINKRNGILIKDNSVSFYKGLEYLYKNRILFKSENIAKEYSGYHWYNIIVKYYKPYLMRLA